MKFIVLMSIYIYIVPKAAAEDRDMGRSTEVRGAQTSERRVALVIGNGRYQHTNPLAGTRYDAEAVADALEQVGFEVMRERDLDRRELILAVLEFGERLKTADIGFFYYSGHGIQVDGKNYLVPVDADIPDERYIELDAVDMLEVLRAMEDGETRLNVVVLDACRNNPFVSQWFSSSRSTPTTGLATVHPSRGFLIAYATNPGNVAIDGGEQVGPYAAALSEAIQVPGRELSAVFRTILDRVVRETQEAQIPWFESVYSGDFYFVPALDHGIMEGLEGFTSSTMLSREPVLEWALDVKTGAGLAIGTELNATIEGVTYTEAAFHWLLPAELSVALLGPRAWLRLGGGGALNLSGPYLFSTALGPDGVWMAGGGELGAGLSWDGLDLGLQAGILVPGRIPVRLVGRSGRNLGVEMRVGLNVVTERRVEPALEILLSERIHLAGARRP